MGRIRARIRAAGAEAQAAGASWEAAFLNAIEETDAALDALASTRRSALAMDKQAQAAEAIAELAEQRTKAGHDSQLDAMAARSRALAAQEGSIRTQGALRSAWINAQVALGAGWRDAGDLKAS